MGGLLEHSRPSPPRTTTSCTNRRCASRAPCADTWLPRPNPNPKTIFARVRCCRSRVRCPWAGTTLRGSLRSLGSLPSIDCATYHAHRHRSHGLSLRPRARRCTGTLRSPDLQGIREVVLDSQAGACFTMPTASFTSPSQSSLCMGSVVTHSTPRVGRSKPLISAAVGQNPHLVETGVLVPSYEARHHVSTLGAQVINLAIVLYLLIANASSVSPAAAGGAGRALRAQPSSR